MSLFKEFKQFFLRGNVVDLAVGVIIGAAFNNIVNTLVKDLLAPLIGMFVKTSDFSSLYFKINGSKFLYGDFINALISFLLVSSAVFFFVVKPMNLLISRAHREPPVDPTIKKCPECLSEIPIEAKRCSYCAQLITQE